MAAYVGVGVSEKWLNDYEKCERLAHEVAEKLDVRDSLVKSGSRNFSQANVPIRPLLKKLNEDLNELRQNLVRLSSSAHITAMEGERRQRLLDNLVSKTARLESAFNGKRGTDYPQRSSLLGDDFTHRNRNEDVVSWTQEDDDDDMPIEDMRQQHQQIIKQQDEGLDALSSVIARQKRLAYAIGDEADLQNELIDDITDHVDRTRDRLIRETRHVEIVTRKSGTCWYWVVIILLLVAIIVIVAIPRK